MFSVRKSLLSLVLLLETVDVLEFSADDTVKYFSYFSQKTGFDISGDNLHEVSDSIFWEK